MVGLVLLHSFVVLFLHHRVSSSGDLGPAGWVWGGVVQGLFHELIVAMWHSCKEEVVI